MNRHAQEAGAAETARAREKELEDLRWHWDEAYRISWDGRFRAARLDGEGSLDAATAAELRELMYADYTARPVPQRYRREPEGGGG